MTIGLLVASAVLATALGAQSQGAAFTVAETGRSFSRLQDAVDAIGEGRGTIRVAPGHYNQCAVQNAGRVAFQAVQPGTAIFDGGACEGKATLVLRGTGASVQGLVFQNIRVPDANGSGIRLEKGNLDVTETMFRDSEQGILTASDPGGAIRISRSTFSGLGRCDRDLACAHGVYIGEYGSLSIDRSRFERGRGGHYVKSRAPRINITDSSFDDTGGRATNYMIDLSNGARGGIARNRFVQGKNKENYSAFIVVAAEGRKNDSTGLAIAGNEVVLGAGAPRPTAFVADLSKDRLAIGANNIGAGIERFQQR
jgi:hypothetical protein